MDVYELTRSAWGADPLVVQVGHPIADPAQFVGLVIHHDVINYTPTTNAAEIIDHAHAVARARPDLGVDAQGRPDWPYSFGVAEHPNPELAWTIEGRGLLRTGAHTAGLNSTRYGVVLFGNYSDRPLTPGMVRAINRLGAWACGPAVKAGTIQPTAGHRQFANTQCPGNGALLSIDAVQPERWPTVATIATPPPDPPLPPDDPEADDMTPDEFLALPIQLRRYRDDGTFDLAPFPMAEAISDIHAEAKLAHMNAATSAAAAHDAAVRAEAAANSASEAALAAHQAAAAATAPSGTLTPEEAATALLGALRGLLTHLLAPQ